MPIQTASQNSGPDRSQSTLEAFHGRFFECHSLNH